MLRSDVCDYSDAYIVLKGTITVEGDDVNKKRDEKLSFKNNSPFRSCISKINKMLQTMQKILMFLWQCIICQKIMAIIL